VLIYLPRRDGSLSSLGQHQGPNLIQQARTIRNRFLRHSYPWPLSNGRGYHIPTYSECRACAVGVLVAVADVLNVFSRFTGQIVYCLSYFVSFILLVTIPSVRRSAILSDAVLSN